MEVILVILAIIGGISSLFKDKITEQPKKKPNQQQRPTTPVPDSTQKKQNDRSSYEPNTETIKTQEQRDEQMQQLAQRMKIDTEENQEEYKVDPAKTLKESEKQEETLKTNMQKRVRNNLNQKGIIDGIIMSEVLGPPRAHKPYQSVIKKRSR